MHKTNTKRLSCVSVHRHTNLNQLLLFQQKWKQIKMGKIAAWNTWAFLSQPYKAEIIQHAKSTVNFDHKEIKSIVTMLETVIIQKRMQEELGLYSESWASC